MSARRRSASAVVAGGGVIGLMTALELERAGYAVTLLERGPLARESSWAGAGLLCPLPPWQHSEPLWALASEGMRRYPALCDELLADTGIDAEWTRSGLMVLDEPAPDAALRWATLHGLAVESVTACEGLAHPQPGLWLPAVAQIRNPRLCRALAALLRQRDVRLLAEVGAAQLTRAGRAVTVEAAGERWQADVVVLGAGAWSAELAAAVGWPLPIVPVKGQMLLLRGAPGVLPSMLLSRGCYLVPRRDGRVLVGSTVEHRGFEKQPTAEAASALRTFAEALAPACRQMPLEAHWAGLRPGTADGLPLIEPHPELNNLWVHAGHTRYGLTMAPASALRLVAVVTGAEPLLETARPVTP